MLFVNAAKRRAEAMCMQWSHKKPSIKIDSRGGRGEGRYMRRLSSSTLYTMPMSRPTIQSSSTASGYVMGASKIRLPPPPPTPLRQLIHTSCHIPFVHCHMLFVYCIFLNYYILFTFTFTTVHPFLVIRHASAPRFQSPF